MDTAPAPARQLDARNRALRTFLQGLAVDLLAAIALTVHELVTADAGLPAWRLLGLAVAKTVLTTAASYVMRAKLDASSFPTPLPPVDPGRPADDDERGEHAAPEVA